MGWSLRFWGKGDKDTDKDNEVSQASDSISGDSLRSGGDPHLSAKYDDAEISEALSDKDITPVKVKGEKLATQTPLITAGMPDALIEEKPNLRLSPYDLERGNYCSNVLALCHNAVRREIVDWEVDVFPGMERVVEKESAEGNECGMEVVAVAGKLGMWWSGFARLILCGSLVEDMIVKKAFEDIYVGYGKETKDIEKKHKRCVEKNTVQLETAIRRVDRSMRTLEDMNEDDDIHEMMADLKRTWDAFTGMLLDMYNGSEQLIASIDKFVREPIEYEDLEEEAARVFITKKKWGQDSEKKRGELLVSLTRWMGDESFMRRWASDNLSKKEAKRFEVWMNDYRKGRAAIVEGFHQHRA